MTRAGAGRCERYIMADEDYPRAMKAEEMGGYVIDPLNPIRCPGCNKLLFYAHGLGAVIQIVCQRCGAKVIWPDACPSFVKDIDSQTIKEVKQLE